MERSDGIVKSFKTSLKNLIGLKSENVSSGENAIGTSLQQTTIGLLNNLLNKARMECRTLSEKISNKKTDGLAIEEVPQVSKTQKQELVFTEKRLVDNISQLQLKIRMVEENEHLCKEEFPQLFSNFPQEHKALVLKEMYKLYSETLESSPEWKQQSDHEKHDQFLSKLQNHLNLSDHTAAFYQNLFK